MMLAVQQIRIGTDTYIAVSYQGQESVRMKNVELLPYYYIPSNLIGGEERL